MILFCDTSALMKLLVDEAQSDQMRQISSTVDAIGVCRISWAETRWKRQPEHGDGVATTHFSLKATQKCGWW